MAEEVKTRVNGAIVEGAPYWYDTPLDQLDFQWSYDEKLEIERYCEKIHKNISMEEMTPKERYEATMTGKPKDRQLISAPPANTFIARTMSAGGDSIKPIDVIRNPKLFVKGHLAYLARFAGVDWPQYMIICYTGIGLYGGRVKLLEYGQPCVVDPPVKSMEDLEGLEDPDPYKDGMFPGYIWANREMRRIFDEYGLSKVMPIWSSLCAGVETLVMEAMMGWSQFIVTLRKDEELCKQATAIGQRFMIKLGKAIIETSKPDAIQICQANGSFQLKGHEWIADGWAELNKAFKAVDPNVRLTNGVTALSTFKQFTDILIERGGAGPGSFEGGITGNDETKIAKAMEDYYNEHEMFFSIGILNTILEKGSISEIDEAYKKLCEYTKPYPKFSPGIVTASAHWTPFECVDLAIEAIKKYGKY